VAGCLCILRLLLFRSQFCLSLAVGESMRPTYQTSDLLLVHKRAYQAADPQLGDIVVARYREDTIVKRIVGLAGETVGIADGQLRINGSPMEENYSIEAGPLDVGKGRVATGKVALFGDNRALPRRMAVPAVVAKDQIIGKVIFAIRFKRSRVDPVEGDSGS